MANFDYLKEWQDEDCRRGTKRSRRERGAMKKLAKIMQRLIEKPCPVCGAVAGEPCVREDGISLEGESSVHVGRRE